MSTETILLLVLMPVVHELSVIWAYQALKRASDIEEGRFFTWRFGPTMVIVMLPGVNTLFAIGDVLVTIVLLPLAYAHPHPSLDDEEAEIAYNLGETHLFASDTS
jgi:hypothetical protein